jgi:hypothetical protein
MGVNYLGDYGPSGSCHGRAAADLIGFYGTTPCNQPANVTSVTTTGSTSTTNAFGYTAAAQADAIVTAVNAIITNLEEMGLMAAS